METRASDRLIELGKEQERQDTRRRALGHLNDILSRIERNGAFSGDVEELESSLKAFRRSEIIQEYEATCWQTIVERYKMDSKDDEESSDEEEDDDLGEDDDDAEDDDEDDDDEDGSDSPEDAESYDEDSDSDEDD